MASLHVLNMIGNPLLRKTVDYRRNLLYKCSDITYLDSRPVTDKDRICLKAWATGGVEAERKERERLQFLGDSSQSMSSLFLVKIIKI